METNKLKNCLTDKLFNSQTSQLIKHKKAPLKNDNFHFFSIETPYLSVGLIIPAERAFFGKPKYNFIT